METYNGHVRTPTDAIILFEACRLGLLPRVQRRLSEKERQSIRSGSVFVWDEREAGMRRWTDGKSWSASRVSGSFLTYREMEGKRGGNAFVTSASRGTKTPDSAGDDQQAGAEGEEGPDGYRYKPDGLMKQSFSITTSQGQHLHLISYYSRSHPTAQVLRQPSNDPSLSSIKPAAGMYPESTINDQSTVPAVTRSPMPGAPNYVMAASPPYSRPGAAHPHTYMHGYMPHPAYMYPMSPMHTPPHYAMQGYPQPPHSAGGLPPLGYPAPPYGQPPIGLNQAPPSTFDQRPLRASVSGPSQAPSSLPQQNSAPPATSNPYAQSQPPPPQPPAVSAPYSQLPQLPSYQAPAYPSPTASTQQEPTGERHAVSLQIDPRLTAVGAPVAEAPQNGSAVRGEESADARLGENNTLNASQAPSIEALVNGITAAAEGEKSQGEAEAERQRSSSPGGTTNGAPPQDIPSEKLGFREDKRALSKLDRVFARV